ncbi:hypothetical protein VPH35_120592 [Triticum aestivum]|uniref:Uncharacterized protein n=1 Tax=Triticum urartu TaxID=4572 RepID=A0A8R7RFF5_TRIUA
MKIAREKRKGNKLPPLSPTLPLFRRRRRHLPSKILRLCRACHRRKGPFRDPLLHRVNSCGSHCSPLPSVRGAGESDKEVQQSMLPSSYLVVWRRREGRGG